MRISMKLLLTIAGVGIFLSALASPLLVRLVGASFYMEVTFWLFLTLFGIGSLITVFALTASGLFVLEAVHSFLSRHEKKLDLDAPIESLEEFFQWCDVYSAMMLGGFLSIVRSVRSSRHATPWFLKAFRMFLSRQKREEIDMIIDDINEDILEMKKDRWSGITIKAVIWWHTIATVVAYTWDGVLSVMNRVVPLAALLKKLGGG